AVGVARAGTYDAPREVSVEVTRWTSAPPCAWFSLTLEVTYAALGFSVPLTFENTVDAVPFAEVAEWGIEVEIEITAVENEVSSSSRARISNTCGTTCAFFPATERPDAAYGTRSGACFGRNGR
ncbi:hypothetical protein QFC20_007775, partial [Naganishia adeliensis]